MRRHRRIAILLSAFASVLAAQGCTTHAQAQGDQLSGHAPAASFPAIDGMWHEDTPTACQKTAGDTAAQPVRELKFDAGKFEVTWLPFETYVDYWGTYTYDRATGALSLKVAGGNHVPADAKLMGIARTDPDAKLQITGIFFGTPGNGGAHIHTSDCPVVFKH